MFNTMTFTKVLGGLLGAFLIFLLGKAAAGLLYTEETDKTPSYVVATESAGAKSDGAEAQVDFGALVAAADTGAGEKVFGKCRACHKVDGSNATGPHLDGVVGRPVASVEGFAYSDALKGLGGAWEPSRLNEFLTSPKAFAPGTKMSFAGLPKVQDRAGVVAYLESLAK